MGRLFYKPENAWVGDLIPYYEKTEPSYWLYTMIVERRDEFISMMEKNGVQASPLHLRNDRHIVFQAKQNETPNLDSFYKSFVHIPCGWWLTVEDREKIVNLIRNGW